MPFIATFTALFQAPSTYVVCDEEADASTVAKRIHEGLSKGDFVAA